jgi:hypothetical protein
MGVSNEIRIRYEGGINSIQAAAQQLIEPDASIGWCSSLLGCFTVNAVCSARVNSGVRLLRLFAGEFP